MEEWGTFVLATDKSKCWSECPEQYSDLVASTFFPTCGCVNKAKSVCSYSFRSIENLPDSVLECFQNPSPLRRAQDSLWSLIGKGSSYDISVSKEKQSLLESVQNKLKKTKQKLLTINFGSKALLSGSSCCKCCSNYSKDPLLYKEELEYQHWKKEREDWSSEDLEILKSFLGTKHLTDFRKQCSHLRSIKTWLSSKRSIENKVVETKSLRSFLLDIGFAQYYSLFNRHGYDLPTALYMDAFDLAAIGIQEPLHRMAIKYELEQIASSSNDSIEKFESMYEWLKTLGLDQYTENFVRNGGIHCPLAAVHMSKKDLQSIGVYMLGHRKKLILSLERIKRLIDKR